METSELRAIAQDYGTPSYVFDLEAFRNRLRECQAIVGPDVHLCFAMKANPWLINAAAQVASKLEVCSPGELDLCERANINPDQIVYSGVNKEICDITHAIEYGAGVLTAESLLHVEYIDQVAREHNLVVDVLPRLNAGSQFGMSKDELLWLVDNRDRFPGLKLVGIHYFVYTQRLKLKHQRKEMAMLSDLIDELANEHDFVVERLEYGPGLGVPYFMDDDFSDDLLPIREIADDLRALAAKTELTIEMGRFFASPCGTYFTKAMDLKSNKGTNYAILDGGMHHITYFGQMMGMHVPPIVNLTREAEDRESEVAEWCLCGSLCTVNDVLVRAVELDSLQRGDVLAFGRCGAYAVTEGVSLFLSRRLPRVLLREADGSVVLARDFIESSQFNGLAVG